MLCDDDDGSSGGFEWFSFLSELAVMTASLGYLGGGWCPHRAEIATLEYATLDT